MHQKVIESPTVIVSLIIGFVATMAQKKLRKEEFPFYMFLSANIFYHFGKYVHDKHALYVMLPYM